MRETGETYGARVKAYPRPRRRGGALALLLIAVTPELGACDGGGSAADASPSDAVAPAPDAAAPDDAAVAEDGGLPDAGCTPRLVYLNREGGTYTQGFEDSRTNRSSVVQETSVAAPWAHGDAAWAQTTDCIRGLLAPYAVELTDADPGSAPHIELVMTGSSSEDFGFGAGIDDVRPFACDIIDNAVGFVFTGTIGSDPAENCRVGAQSLGGLFTLDFHYQCDDVMTYLSACDDLLFRDEDMPCGEFEPRGCMCGGDTQNSHQHLLSKLGPACP